MAALRPGGVLYIQEPGPDHKYGDKKLMSNAGRLAKKRARVKKTAEAIQAIFREGHGEHWEFIKSKTVNGWYIQKSGDSSSGS